MPDSELGWAFGPIGVASQSLKDTHPLDEHVRPIAARPGIAATRTANREIQSARVQSAVLNRCGVNLADESTGHLCGGAGGARTRDQRIDERCVLTLPAV